MQRISGAILIGLAFLAPIQRAHAAEPYLATGTEMAPPVGFVEMCSHASDWCGSATPGRGASVAATDIVDGMADPLAMLLSFTTRSAAVAPAWPSAIGAPDGQFPGLFDMAGAVAASLRARDGDFAFMAMEPMGLRDLAPIRVSDDTHLAVGAVTSIPVEHKARRSSVRRPPRTQGGLLRAVNAEVNGKVEQKLDIDVTGQADLWRRSGIAPGAVGDCEDIAIEKRHQLVERGFPRDRLAFAIVYEHDIGLHAVLLARTDAGDVVLDSRTRAVRRWSDLRYQWVSVQSMTEPGRWYVPSGALKMADS